MYKNFGGTSVGSVERIQHVANLIIEEYERGHSIVSVVSAMGKSTDELVALANAITENPSKTRNGYASIDRRASNYFHY